MIDTIYVARHGFRMNWVNESWKSVTGLARDPPLAAFGESQANELASYFLSLPEADRPTAIFSSPFYRCLQTANPTAVALGVPLYVEHGVGEWYSPAKAGTGLHPRPASAQVLRQHFPQIDPSWASVWYPPRKGEGVEEVHDRVGGSVEAIFPVLERMCPGQHTKILFVSHAATVIALVRELVGDRSLPLRVGCCSLSKLSRKSGRTDVRGAWDPIMLASGDHLAEDASRDWGFEDILIENGKVVEDIGLPGSENDEDYPVGCQVQDTLAKM